MDEEQIYKDALKAWGIDAQCMMAIEECGELITALSHKYRGREANLIEEIADVKIMIEQLSIIFGAKEVEEAKIKKLSRLNQRLLNAGV